MEPIDGAAAKFSAIVDSDLPQYAETMLTEADVRTKLIDRIFVEVLGWPFGSIHLESPAGEGFIDYRCTVESLNRLIIEAKRQGRDLGISPDRSARFFKLNGSVFNSPHAKEGIDQAIRYCAYKNAELACVTNGRQWIVFLANRRGDGKDTLDGLGCVFGSLETVKDKFKLFFDLLAYDSVGSFRYRGIFQEAEGQPIRTNVFRSPIRKPDSRRLLPADRLYADIDRVMLSFFRDLSDKDDPELRRQCFVTSRESDRAEETLARISEELRNKIRTLGGGNAAEITAAIRRVQEMQRHEFVLLVGTKGAGKSTFIERFFEDVLPRDVAKDCVLVRIDMADCGADESNVIPWLDQHFLETAEQAVFEDGTPNFDHMRGMYWREYERWRDGSYKYLYDSDKTQFNIEFGKHIERRREERPHEYIVHLLHRIIHSDGRIPCLVFDNADHFTIEFQERVFQYAHSLYEQVLCLVLVPITDKTSWQLSRQGALQSFFTESFFLPTPAADLVLRRRIEYIEVKIADEGRGERGRGYFFGRGIELSIDNLQAFASSIQAVFINTGQVANWIGDLANCDVRRCLQLTREMVASPHIKVDELLKAFVARSSVVVDPVDAKLAIVRGKYDIYPVSQNAFVQNIFALTTEFDTTPLLGVRILQLLEDTKFEQPDGEARYVDVEHVIEYSSAMNIDSRVVARWIDTMLKCGLVLSYDPTVAGVEQASRIEISPSGRQHLIWAGQDWVYIEAMMEVTPLLDREVFNQINAFTKVDMPYGRRKAIQAFLTYLMNEDSKYCLVPDHEMYLGQRKLVDRLKQQYDNLNRPARSSGASRYGRPYGKIASWDADKGYGFISPEDGSTRDVFFHQNDMVNPRECVIKIGALVEYDLKESEKGLKALRVAGL